MEARPSAASRRDGGAWGAGGAAIGKGGAGRGGCLGAQRGWRRVGATCPPRAALAGRGRRGDAGPQTTRGKKRGKKNRVTMKKKTAPAFPRDAPRPPLSSPLSWSGRGGASETWWRGRSILIQKLTHNAHHPPPPLGKERPPPPARPTKTRLNMLPPTPPLSLSLISLKPPSLSPSHTWCDAAASCSSLDATSRPSGVSRDATLASTSL